MSRKLDIHAQCIGCKHSWVMNPEQLRDAKIGGAATCPHCHNVAVVTKAEVKASVKKGGGR